MFYAAQLIGIQHTSRENIVSKLRELSHNLRMLYSTIHIQEYKHWSNKTCKEAKDEEKDSNCYNTSSFTLVVQQPSSHKKHAQMLVTTFGHV